MKTRAYSGACRAELRRRFVASGACILDKFLAGPTVDALLEELAPLVREAYVSTTYSTVYLQPADPGFPLGHPRRSEQMTRLGTLAEDQLSLTSPLRALHGSTAFRRLIGDIVGVSGLYGYVDGLSSVNVLVFHTGHELGWHFDEAEYAVTLLLKSAASGGTFEYVRNLRSIDRANFAAVQELLAGGGGAVSLDHVRAGDLILFRGRDSLHRVTPVCAGAPRIVAVLSYDSRPDRRLSEHDRDLFFGRVG